MILGNTTKAFYCNSCLEKIFLGFSESFLSMVLTCSYVVQSGNGSERLPSNVAQPSIQSMQS